MKKLKKKYFKTVATNNKTDSVITVERHFRVKVVGVPVEHVEYIVVPYVLDPATNIVTITATMEAVTDLIAIINA